MKIGFYKCGNCALHRDGTCWLRNQPMGANDYCSKHKNELDICDNCGQIIAEYPLIWTKENNQIFVLCKNCFRRL